MVCSPAMPYFKFLRPGSYDGATHAPDLRTEKVEGFARMAGGGILAVGHPERGSAQVDLTPDECEELAVWLARVTGGTFTPRPRPERKPRPVKPFLRPERVEDDF